MKLISALLIISVLFFSSCKSCELNFYGENAKNNNPYNNSAKKESKKYKKRKKEVKRHNKNFTINTINTFTIYQI